MKKRNLLITTLLVLGSLLDTGTLQAQQVQLSGKISDGKAPLANATVALTSLIAAGEVKHQQTNAKGEFIFLQLSEGYYSINVSFTGFTTYRKDSLYVSANTAPLLIAIAPKAGEMKAVTVTGKTPFIVQEADKLVLNVEASPIAAGGTSWDVLLKAPGLVERDGSLQFKGKSVNVLINGRPSNLSGEDLKNMLVSMPANTIEKIELISNPSSKYDAQGGAIINIKLAKIKGLGTNGIVTIGAGGGQHLRYNGSLSLNHRTKKMNIYGSYDRLHYTQYFNTASERKINAATTVTDDSREIRYRDNNSYKIGLDYDINKRNSFGVLIKGFLNERDREVTNQVKVAYQNPSADSLSTVATQGYAKFSSPAVNLYYKTILDSLGSELMVNADYFRYNKDWSNGYSTHYYDDKGVEYRAPYLLRDQSPAIITVKSATVDYSYPAKWAKLEAGLKAVHTVTDNDVRWEAQYNNDWKPDPGRTNHFIYTEDIYAAYLTLSKRFGKLDVKTGIRAEQTMAEGELRTSGEINKTDYLNFFPSASVGYKLSDDNSLSLSYRKSIRRFGYDIVNPFIVYYNQYSYYQGNPAIRPSLSHNFELSHAFKNKLFTSLSYLRIENSLAEVYKQDPASNAQIRTYENLASADQVGLDISYMEMLLQGKWMLTTSIGAVYAKYNDAESLQGGNATKAVYVSSSNIFKLKKNWGIEVAGNFFSPMVYGVYKFQSQGSVDAGFTKSWSTNKWKFALSVSDLFNTLKQRYDVHSYGIASQYRYKAESRYLKANLTYRFGNKTVKASRNRNTGFEEAKERTGSN
jgi:outer membrane receptor protein involved in Fe transport